MTQLTFKRCEIKYQLTEEQCARLMQAMAAYMVPDAYGASTVCNVYCDTPSSLLIRRSLEKPTYKEKVRLRSYGILEPQQPVFLELKKKSEGVVYKRRATMDTERAAAFLAGHGDPQNQIERELDFTIRRYGGLMPKMFIAYDRVAFYAKDDHEFRMTFDRHVRYRNDDLVLTKDDAGMQILPDGMVLLEVKCGGAMPLWLTSFLSAERIFKKSFSKYGTAYQTQLAARKLATAPQPRSVAVPWLTTLPVLGQTSYAPLTTAIA